MNSIALFTSLRPSSRKALGVNSKYSFFVANDIIDERTDGEHQRNSKGYGITVTPMSFLDADSGRGNIRFGKGALYEENCQCCVAVHEARLRGLNLTAVA